MIIAICPLCEEKIKAGRKLIFFQRLICPGCDAVLEVVRLNPLELDWLCEEEYKNYEVDYSAKTGKAKYPSCGEKVETDPELWFGQHITCSACDEEIEVVSVNPLKLDRLDMHRYYEYDHSLDEEIDS